MKFINRKNELELLKKEFDRPSSGFIVLYGRRRIGKTRLIEEFIKNKDSIYYLAADETDVLQIKEFQAILAEFFQDEFLATNNFSDWKNLFAYLKKVWPKKKIVLAIDEVTYIIKNNPSFPSYLQQFWDTFLSKTNCCLILSGSLVGLMLMEVLSGKSPLYGRRTAEILLEELGLKHVQEFLDLDLEEAIKFFAIIGGIPKYLEVVEKPYSSLLKQLFNKRSFFYREGLYLMTEEFNEIAVYSNILKAISEGHTKLAEIAECSGLETKKISAYIDILENIGFIKAITPVTQKKFRGKMYLINDSLLEFWFRFTNKNRSSIELDKTDHLIKENEDNINAFIGRKFEDICKGLVSAKWPKVSKQWGKFLGEPGKNTYEIDICAINEKTKEILFAECKWQDNVNAKRILTELKEKAKHVKWHNEERKEHYMIFAKSFKEKTKECIDLNDIAKFLDR